MRKLLTLIALGLLVSFGTAQTIDGAVADGEYANSISDEESGFTLSWTIDGDTIHMAVQTTSSGWIGVGWAGEQTNRKAGFDQHVFTVEDGSPVALDMFQPGARGEPDLDTAEGGTDSLTAFAATYEGEAWTVEFSRPLDTGEDTDVAIVPGTEMIFAVARGDTMDTGREHDRSSRGGAFYIDPFTF